MVSINQSMKQQISAHLIVRLVSVATILTIVAVEFIMAASVSIPVIASALSSASMALLCYPDRDTSSPGKLWPSGAILISSALMMLLRQSCMYMTILSALIVLAFWGYKVVRKYSHPQALFCIDMVWEDVCDVADLLFALLTFILDMALITVLASGSDGCLVMILFATLFFALYYRSLSGHTLILSGDDEDRIRELIRKTERVMPVSGDETRAMRSLYMKLVKLMEEKKPYLDDGLTVRELSSMLATNRTYLSRTINVCYGKHVRTFINSYRIQSAMDMLREDPSIRIGDLLSACGFKSLSAFDSAFKIKSGMTPTEYAQMLQLGIEDVNPKPLSSLSEREQ